MESEENVIVKTVYRDSAAEQADFKVGDELLSVNRHRIATPAELRRELRAASEQETSVVTVLRGGRRVDLPVHLAGTLPAGSGSLKNRPR